MFPRRLRHLTISLLALASCGRDAPFLSKPSERSLVLRPGSFDLYMGQRFTFDVALSEGGSERSVLSEAAVVVDPEGVVILDAPGGGYVRSAGEARLVASYSGLTTSASIVARAGRLTAIEVAPTSLDLEVGGARDLTVTGRLSDGTSVDLTLGATGTRYSSEDPSVASVDLDGVVRGTGRGETTIVVSHGRSSASVSVRVSGDPPPKGFISIRIEPELLTLGVGQSATLRVMGTAEDRSEHDLVAEGFEVSFDSTNPQILTISPSGLAIAQSTVGVVEVTAHHAELTATARIEVRREVDRRLISVVAEPPAALLKVGETLPLKVTGTYSDDTQADLTPGATGTTYRPAPPNGPASVGPNGLVRANRPGSSVITVTNSGLTDTVEVRVLEAEVTLAGLEIAPERMSMTVGDSQPFTVTAIYSDRSRNDVTSSAATTYSVAPRGVITVRPGLVMAQSEGTAELRISFGGLSRILAVTVSSEPATLVGLRIEPNPIRITLGNLGTYRVLARYSDGSERDVTASRGLRLQITDPGIAGLSAAIPPSIVPIRAGETFLEASFQSVDARARIIVEDPMTTTYVGLILVVANTITVGSTAPWRLGGVRSDGQVDDLTTQPGLQVSVSNSNVISANIGSVQGLRVGVSDLTVRIFGLSATRSVRVVAVEDPVVRLEFVPSSLTMNVGDQMIVQLFAIYQSGARRDITYDPGVSGNATGPVDLLPDANGVIVVALGPGRAQIDVTFENLSATLPITILGLNPTLIGLEVVAPTEVMVGGVAEYQVLARYSDGSVRDVTTDPQVFERVSPPGVATLISAGAVRGDSPGVAMLEAAFGGFQANAFIRVVPAPFVAIEWSPSTLTLRVGDSAPAEVIGRRADGSTTRIAPSGLDGLTTTGPVAVRVTSTGILVVGTGVGSGEVRATLGTLSAVLPVSVTPGPATVVAIRGEPNPLGVGVGQSAMITVIATYSDGRESALSGAMFSSLSMTVSVDGSGRVTGISAGTGTVRIDYAGLVATVTVNVGATPVSLSITPNPVDVDVGSVVPLLVTILMSDGTTQLGVGATFESADVSIATVGPLGGVRGVAAGSTFVTVTAMGLSGRVAVTVHAVPPPVLTRLDPDAVAVGSGAMTIRALGADFRVGDRILFDGGPIVATFVSANELTFRLAGTVFRTAGAHRVQVERPSTAQRSVFRTLRVGDPPRILELLPSSVREGTTEDVEAVGSGLTGLTIAVSGNSVTLCCAAEAGTSVQFRVTAPMGSAGTYVITFTNDFGSTTATLTVVAGPADLVVLGGQTVHLSGANTYHNVRIESGGTLIGDGFTPLHIFAEGQITVLGTIDASGSDGADGFRGPAEGGNAGPGGGGGGGGADGNTMSPAAGGQGAPNGQSAAVGAGSGTPAGAGGGNGAGAGAVGGCGEGGGGGGFGGAGGNGGGDAGDGRGAHGGAAGGGSDFSGGTGGGGATTCSDSSGGGGGGGGGVLILETAGGPISISGTLRANGGRGGDGFGSAGGGGGGSGGRIQLVAAGGRVTVSGTVEALGGNGGNTFNGDAGGGGGGGQLVVSAGSTSIVGVLDVAGGNGGLSLRGASTGRPGAGGTTSVSP
ncbi:MAG: Ig-like domain-containing protein [Deltaproteobacteria bacterium]|nr:Ig-like domain-containing protein [Deltaproteobacteria bacterium]